MAGNYPDAPSWRMAYDEDGTQVIEYINSAYVRQWSASDLATINDESTSAVAVTSGATSERMLCFIFPELRDLDAFFYKQAISGLRLTGLVQVSANTTNGLDGTWTTLPQTFDMSPGIVSPNYRTAIQSTTTLGIKAVRLLWAGVGAGANAEIAPSAFHMYGEIVPGQNPERLVLWHPTLDQHVGPAHFDWGDAARSSTQDIQFRVKNVSPTKAGNNIRVAQSIRTDGVPSVVAQHVLSLDGVTFLAQVNIGSLSPGAISQVLTLRRITPSNAALGLWAFRVFADAESWT